MCLAPIQIRNPNYGKDHLSVFGKDVLSQFINVPCGHCTACIANRQMQQVQRVQMEALNHHLFFCTLTYNNDMIPKLVCSTGYEFMYADFHDLQNMFKLLRKYNDFGRPFKYYAVSERGSKRGRPHFHILFSLPKYSSDDYNTILQLEHKMFTSVISRWCRNHGTNRKPKYVPLFTYNRKFVRGVLKTNFDLHYVDPSLSMDGESDVAFYVTKYILKSSPKEVRLQRALKLNLSPEEYDLVWKTIKSRTTRSHDFGFDDASKDYVLSCLPSSVDDVSLPYPVFFNPSDGRPFPMAQFYKRRLYTLDHYNLIRARFPDRSDHVVIDDSDLNFKIQKLNNINRIRKEVFRSELFDDFSDTDF